jgi:hypothetical protein
MPTAAGGIAVSEHLARCSFDSESPLKRPTLLNIGVSSEVATFLNVEVTIDVAIQSISDPSVTRSINTLEAPRNTLHPPNF